MIARALAGLVLGILADALLLGLGLLALHAALPMHGPGMAGVPFPARLLLVLIWVVAAYGGAYAALAIGRAGASIAWLVVLVQIGLAIRLFIAIHHPSWMIALAVLGPVLAVYAALATVPAARRS